MAATPVWGPASADAALHLYVPDMMMAGEPYEGMILLDSPPPRPYPVLLASGSGAAVPEVVIVAAGMNHAIFPVRPGTAGPYTIAAVPPDGAAVSAGYEVFPGEGRRLAVVAPALSEGTLRTAARDTPLLIYLTDHLGRPAPSPGDTAISLDAPPTIRVPAGPLVIPANRTHTLAMISIHGSGPVHASSPGMPGDTLQVVMVDDPVTVRVGVAPDPAPAGTAVPYFVWLERGGRPYDPGPDAIHDVYVSTSSPAVADLRPAGRPGDAIHHQHMSGGLLRGTLYTGPAPTPGDLRGSPSRATITASIPGVGSGSAVVSIGAQPEESLPEVAAVVRQCLGEGGGGTAARPGGCAAALRIFAMMNGRVAAGSGQDPGTIYLEDAGHAAVQGVREAVRAAGTEGPADTIRLWAFPDGPSGKIWMVAGFYMTVPGVPEAAAPARPAGPVRMTLPDGSAPGAGGYPGGYPAGHPPVLVIPLEVRGSINATLAGRGLEPSSIHLEGPGGHLGIQAALSVAPRGAIRDGILGMVWVEDAASGHLVEAGAARHLVEVSGYGGASVEAVAWRGPAAGIILGSWDGPVPGGVQARMVGSAPIRQEIVPHDDDGGDDGGVSGIRLWAPGRVHVSEEFPVAVHAVDADGRPVSRIDGAALVSDAATTVPGGRMVAGPDGGGISAVWGGHSDRLGLEAFLNPAGGDIRVAHSGEGRVRLGGNITVTVAGVAPPAGTASVSISGTLDFDGPPGAGTHTARPGSPGNHSATVTVSRPGWEDHTRTIHWEVDHLVEVSYTADSDDGVSVPFTVTLEEPSGEGPPHRLVPGAATLVSPGAYIARIEERPSLGGQAYRLSGVDVSGKPYGAAPRLAVTILDDTAISSSYERVVLVEAAVSGAAAGAAVRIEGTGAYRFGEPVLLEAPRVPEWMGLVWLVPESWEGLPGGSTLSGDGGTAGFAALRSVDVTVAYGRSYTVLVLAMAAGAAAPILLFRSALTESAAGAVAAVRGRGAVR